MNELTQNSVGPIAAKTNKYTSRVIKGAIRASKRGRLKYGKYVPRDVAQPVVDRLKLLGYDTYRSKNRPEKVKVKWAEPTCEEIDRVLKNKEWCPHCNTKSFVIPQRKSGSRWLFFAGFVCFLACYVLIHTLSCAHSNTVHYTPWPSNLFIP